MKKGSVLRTPFSEEITPTKGLTGMENENKWEYDYSKLYQDGGQPAPAPEQQNAAQAQPAAPQAAQGQPAAAQQPAENGYVNVGSSGTNAANQYEGGPQAAISFAVVRTGRTRGWR